MRVQVFPIRDRLGFFSVVPYGSIDSDTSADFSRQVDHLLVRSTKGIILDLQHVDYISSAGLGVLFSIKKSLKQHDGDLFFCNIKPQIRKLFEMVKALPDATLFENAEDADRYFYRIMNEEIEKRDGKKSL